MTGAAPLIPASAAVFLLMLTRIGTLLMFVPGLGGRSVPTPIKVGLALALTVTLVPFNQVDATQFDVAGRFAVALAQEFLVGLTLGFAVAVVFAAIEMAAGLVSFQMGLNLAPVFNPTFNSQGVPLNTFYLVIASLVFLAADGHHLILLALQRSFETVPLGTATISGNAESALIGVTSAMFVDALRIGLPVAGTLLIADAALGILSRMVPQMNVFFVGLPAKMFLGFGLLLLTLPFLLRVLTSYTTQGLLDAMTHAGGVVR